jgi:hypothetical protein
MAKRMKKVATYVNVARLNNPANARLIADALRNLGFVLVGGGPQLDVGKRSLEVGRTEIQPRNRRRRRSAVLQFGRRALKCAARIRLNDPTTQNQNLNFAVSIATG